MAYYNGFQPNWVAPQGYMGMPNPLQKIHYTMDENQMKYLPAGQSGSPEPNYVTKEDLDIFKNELREMLKNNQMQRNNGQQNRGGNS